MKTFDDLKKEYIKLVIKLDEYDKASNLISDVNYNSKLSIKLGKKIDSIAIQLMKIDLNKYIELLDDNNIAVREMTAEYLYPLYPTKCIEIMKQYRDQITKDVDRIKIDSKINGLLSAHSFFINLYKNLYNVDDLDQLNREK